MDIFEQLRRDEGLRLKPYTDSVGKLTIGYGRNLEDRGIRQNEAEVLLENDVAEVSHQLVNALPWTTQLDEARFGVLINMAFNMGFAELLMFRKTLALVQAGEYAQAAKEMLDSKWAQQVGGRAIRLSKQMETGLWQ